MATLTALRAAKPRSYRKLLLDENDAPYTTAVTGQENIITETARIRELLTRRTIAVLGIKTPAFQYKELR